MKPKYLIGLVLAAGVVMAAVLLAVQTQQIYVDFSSAAESGDNVQVKGTWVKEAPSSYSAEHNLFQFTLRDGSGGAMVVEFRDAKPNNFELAEEVVVGGRVSGNKFLATSVLTKCPSKYEQDSIDTGVPGSNYGT